MVGMPRLIAPVGLAVAGDLAVYALKAPANPGRDLLDRLAPLEPVVDLDAVVLGPATWADRLLDMFYRPSVDEPQLGDTPRPDASVTS